MSCFHFSSQWDTVSLHATHLFLSFKNEAVMSLLLLYYEFIISYRKGSSHTHSSRGKHNNP